MSSNSFNEHFLKITRSVGEKKRDYLTSIGSLADRNDSRSTPISQYIQRSSGITWTRVDILRSITDQVNVALDCIRRNSSCFDHLLTGKGDSFSL